jgi:hypothetical protein
MFVKTVRVTLIISESPVEVLIQVSCTPYTLDEEIIRRAGNLLRKAANNAEYMILK